MSKPHLPKKFLDQLYNMNILDPDQDPLKQFQEMQDLQRLYESGNAPPAITQDPDPNKSQVTTTPSSSSTDSKQSTQDPVQTLFADRARRLETDRKEKEATEKAQRKAKALAKKEATSLKQGAAMSKQKKFAEEKEERLNEENVAKERVLKQIEVDKVEREERRKEAARAEADGVSRGSKSDRPNRAYATDTMPRSGSSRPNSFLSGQLHQCESRSESRPSPSSLSSSYSTGPSKAYAPRNPNLSTRDRPSTLGISDREYSNEDYANDEGYSDQSYTPRSNNRNQKSSQRSRPPSRLTPEDNSADQRRPSFPTSQSSSSRPFPSESIRHDDPLESSHGQRPSFPTIRPDQLDRSNLSASPRAGTYTSSRSPRAPRRKTIERFSDHECVWREPHSSSQFSTSHVHPVGDNECSHCDRSYTNNTMICHPCVVRGCRGQWCYDCWDAMNGRKRVAGGGVTRPPGWQVCRYRRQDRKGGRGR